MVPFFVFIYLLLTLGIGVLAAQRVRTSSDFCLAGQKLPVWMCSASMFSTWYGAETIVGAPSEFLQSGMIGIIEDPFGTTLCFLLLGRFFARKIYQLNFLTVSDFIKQRYGPHFEKLFSIMMMMCYLGWVGAQFLAMSVVLQSTTGVDASLGLWLSAALVCAYTLLGGMWSVSYNDTIQSCVIIFSLIFIALMVWFNIDFSTVRFSDQTLTGVRLFSFYPEQGGFFDWVKYISSWIAIGFGSISGQDVFQRVMSAKSEQVAARSAYYSAGFYLIFGLVPVFITYLLKISYADLDFVPVEQVLIDGIRIHTGVLVQTLFFGALLSAIMSSASGGLIAVSVTLAENVIKPYCRSVSDREFLLLVRGCVIISGVLSAGYAAHNPKIYQLLLEASAFSTATQFVPFCFGLYSKKPGAVCAFCSVFAGFLTWSVCVIMGDSSVSPLFGVSASLVGYLIPLAYQKWFKFQQVY